MNARHAPTEQVDEVRARRVGRPLVASSWLLGAVGAAVAITAWELAARTLAEGTGQIARLAGPVAVAREVGGYVTGSFWLDVLASLQVFACGWLVGGGLATLVGLLLGRIRIARLTFLPVVEAIRPVSSIAWVPLAIVWFGLGYTSKVFIVGLAVFLVVIVYAVDGSQRIPPDLQRTATMLGMRPLSELWNLVLPGTLTEVLIGLRVSLMAGWGTVIIAELIAADNGLGAHLVASQRSYDIEGVMAAMACFAVTGFVLNAAFAYVQIRLTPWKQMGRS